MHALNPSLSNDIPVDRITYYDDEQVGRGNKLQICPGIVKSDSKSSESTSGTLQSPSLAAETSPVISCFPVSRVPSVRLLELLWCLDYLGMFYI